jgi:hypothetical protein
MDINPLVQWQSLRSYVGMMSNMITAWEDFFLAQEIDWITADFTSAWLSKLRTSLEVLESQHVYDSLDTLVTNPRNSGFPLRRHIDMLQHKQSRSTVDLAEHRQAKQLFLDSLFAKAEVGVSALANVAKRRVTNRLATEELIEPFGFVGIFPLKSPSKERDAYVCIWERFTDKPMLYSMVFESDAGWKQSAEEVSMLCDILLNVTALELPLAKIARRVDIADARIHPKWVSRIVLGPVWIPGVTADDHFVQQLLDGEHNAAQLSASRVLYEYALSESEATMTSSSRIRDRNGRKHKVTQVYSVRPELEYRERGAAFMQETLFVPHRLIQQLESNAHVQLGHQLIAIEKGN